MYVVICVLIFSGIAGAYVDPQYSGEYLFTADLKNYSEKTETNALQTWLKEELGKDIQLQSPVKLDDFKNGLREGTSGEFEGQITYYGVKAGDSIAFFSLQDFQNGSIDWSTFANDPVGQKKNQPGISHLTVWTAIDAPPLTAIPEPTSIFLVGVGLLGLLGLSRKMKR